MGLITFGKSLLYPLRRPRPFQAYCVSLGKSGTHSIADLFSSRYRAKHEMRIRELIRVYADCEEGRITYDEKKAFFLRRDRQEWLAMEASTALVNFLDVIVKEFPDAKFIVTIRDCYSWLNSALNHAYYRGITPAWQLYNDHFYGPDKFIYSHEKELFAGRNLYSLDSHLSVWRKHNEMIFDAVPAERMMVIRLKEITPSIGKMEDFLGIPTGTIENRGAHKFKAVNDAGLLFQLDREFLEERVQHHCADLMQRFFPEIKCLDDSLKRK